MAVSNNLLHLPNLGLGLGLRSQHFDHILEQEPEVDWFEIISENFMDSHGRPRHVIRQIAARYPVVMHGVSLSIGSTNPLDMDYLKSLKALAEEIQPKWISDHLCWTGVLSVNSHDLLPLPLNEESLKHVCERICQVQDFLGRPLVIENPSTYATFKHSTIPEWEFLTEMTKQTDCGLLLDVNNVYVSSFNNDFDPIEYLEGIPHDRVVQMHLAGHHHCGTHIIDTHDREVTQQVWELFQLAWQRTGGTSTLLEWDGNVPSFEVYHAELLKSKQFMEEGAKAHISPVIPTKAEAAVSNPIHVVTPEITSYL